jgi:hypothetical protein
VNNELTADIDWANGADGGTVVSIDIPLRYVTATTGVK